jgi:hypothetical protein
MQGTIRLEVPILLSEEHVVEAHFVERKGSAKLVQEVESELKLGVLIPPRMAAG